MPLLTHTLQQAQQRMITVGGTFTGGAGAGGDTGGGASFFFLGWSKGGKHV